LAQVEGKEYMLGIKIGEKVIIMANIINRTLDEENKIFLNKRISEEYMLI